MIEILLIDDNRGDVPLMKECMTNYSAAITVAEDGERALDLLRRETYRPNLVILELKISGLQGHELLRRIRRQNERVPIVVLSASSSQEDISQAYASGANMYAEKPSDVNAFRRTIHGIARLWVKPLVGAFAAHAG
jgi:CheY-like chemotaxis protein